MPGWFEAAPGRLYVVAALLPLAGFVLLLLGGGVRSLCRPFRKRGGVAARLYWAYGGDTPLKTGAYLATALMAGSAALAVVGLVAFLNDTSHEKRWAERVDWVRLGPLDSAAPPVWAEQRAADPLLPAPKLGLALEVGYKIDHLTAVLFAMVTVIGTLIFVFSLGYMRDETQPLVEEPTPPAPLPEGKGEKAQHEVRRDDAHAAISSDSPLPFREGGLGGVGHARRGRFGRFFLYLSLFSFSMLNLLIADNLFQVFVSWELVGVCSFFLIGFFYERSSAGRAANKAFIVNRVGDAGFLVGILIAWTSLGTLNFEEMTQRLRPPGYAGVIRGDATDRGYVGARDGAFVRLDPLVPPRDAPFTAPAVATYTTFGVMPYGLFVLMGVGIFLGCAGKSAQIPLQTWLPDAMEGPTPVSALIHAATMVAAGVYLVGRCFPLFAPEVLLGIAYIGAATLFVSATIALVQTDIKRVLAYSTCSQLGFMMLALGVGGWVAGLLHLVTHAFFKALLFLCAGSVIHGCHHEQDLRKMGGLRRRMPLTAFTMLVGVLAISGAPFFSGWYSKDMILSSALGYIRYHPEHALLFVLPALTAAMTAYYMFRLWFLAFTGTPRDHHVHDHAHESPAAMTVPLVVLAVFSVGVAWGWPLWDAEASYLGHVLAKAEPARFAHGHAEAHHAHLVAGLVALAAALAGAVVAYFVFYRRPPAPEVLHATGPAWYRFLLRKWYFDEAYDAAVVRPALGLARTAAALDKRPPEVAPRRFDAFTLDGLLNAIGQAAAALGQLLRRAQTGFVRSYVFALALTAALLLGMLAVLAK